MIETANHHGSNESDCRLCGGKLTYAFTNVVLCKHSVKYYRCNACLSLQTEKPYWLDEAYKNSNLSNTDTGAAQRNLTNLAACYTVSKIFKANNVIDVGGGDGLLCRLLRDYKINCFVKDKYSVSTYGQGFRDENFNHPDLIIAFEVIEHYPNPKSDLDDLFSKEPRLLLVSTGIYTDQSKDWWYISPESGQHIFFYNSKALKKIADRYGYHIIFVGGYILFTKEVSNIKKLLVRFLLKGRVLRLVKSVIALLPAPGVWTDHLLQVESLNAHRRREK
jgi:hypothetical protein